MRVRRPATVENRIGFNAILNTTWGAHEFDVDGLFGMLHIVILAECFPALRNHLNQEFSRRNYRHMAHARTGSSSSSSRSFCPCQTCALPRTSHIRSRCRPAFFLLRGDDDRKARVLGRHAVSSLCGVCALSCACRPEARTIPATQSVKAIFFNLFGSILTTRTRGEPFDDGCFRHCSPFGGSRKSDVRREAVSSVPARPLSEAQGGIDSASCLSYFQSANNFRVLRGN